MKKPRVSPYRHRWIYLVIALAIVVGGIVALMDFASTQPNATCTYCKSRFHLPHKQTKEAEFLAVARCPECGAVGSFRFFHQAFKD